MKWILVCTVVVVLGGAAFYIYSLPPATQGVPTGRTSISTTASSTTPGEIIASSTLVTRTVPPGSREYANATYGISLFYPNNLAVTEYAEAAGGRTVSFDTADGSQGFQIYITPFSDTQISQSRIMLDTHNTAVLPPEEVILGSGQHALLFTSTDSIRGPLEEVWFIRKSWLYEVTTYGDSKEWLASILNTLTFF